MPWLKTPLAQIAGLALGLAVLQPLVAIGAASREVAVPLVVAIGFAYAMPVILALWVAADMRDRGRTPCFDLPFLLLLVWPLSLFWYCIWTRGSGGLLLSIGLVALSYFPAVTTTMVWIAWLIISR